MKRLNKYDITLWFWILFYGMATTYGLATTSAETNKKFQLELYGGLALVQPKDFNKIPETDASIQYFMLDTYQNYLLTNGMIRSWSQPLVGSYGAIKKGLPAGFRLKYHLNSSLAVSVGFKYLLANRSSDPSYEYDRRYGGNFSYQDARAYQKYNLTAQAFAPMVGLHLGTPLTSKIDIAGYLGGGPLFGQCRHKKNYTTTWRETTATYSIVLYEENGVLDIKGTGTGIVLEGGLKVNIQMGTSWGLFMEGVYAYQKVTSLSGSGSARRGDALTSWDGQWGMKHEEITSLFVGTLPLEYPSNSWRSGETPARDFELDLSGFECRIGVFFRF